MLQATNLRRMVRFAPVVLLGAMLLAGCTAPGSSASPTAAGTPEASGVSSLEDCGATDLKTPQGARIDLTGTWSGGTTIHDLRQIGDCVWWMGQSEWPNESLGSLWAIVFSGHLHPDFTLSGEFTYLYGGEPDRGLVTFNIEVQVVDGAEEIVLHRDNTLQLENQQEDYLADTLTRVP